MLKLDETQEVREHRRKLTRVERYGWTVQDSPGQFMMIDKNVLQFDHDAYQRQANSGKVNEIAKNWSWLACGAITVARRPDGQLWVVEGQYRVLAARKREDIEKLSCLVFDVADIKVEAKAFLTVNSLRKNPTVVEKFKGMVTAEMDEAVFVEGLLEELGRAARRDIGPTSAGCLGTMIELAKRNKQMLAGVAHLSNDVCKKKGMPGMFIRTLFYIEENILDGETVLSGKWRDRLITVGFDDLMEGAKTSARYHCKSGASIWAEGMVKRINKGLRVHLRIENGTGD